MDLSTNGIMKCNSCDSIFKTYTEEGYCDFCPLCGTADFDEYIEESDV